jgi:hypothetical protein
LNTGFVLKGADIQISKSKIDTELILTLIITLNELVFKLMILIFNLFCTILIYFLIDIANLNNDNKLNNKVVNLNTNSFNVDTNIDNDFFELK